MVRSFSIVWCLGVLFCAAILLLGCQEDPRPDVPVGAYRAHVKGALEDTLSGPAIVRGQEGRLVALELGERNGEGLSIEVGPAPLHARSYPVIAAELLEGTSEGPAGLFAFLSLEEAQFEAVAGSLSVTHADKSELRATFRFVMNGSASGSPENVTVRVRGDLRATRK